MPQTTKESRPIALSHQIIGSLVGCYFIPTLRTPYDVPWHFMGVVPNDVAEFLFPVAAESAPSVQLPATSWRIQVVPIRRCVFVIQGKWTRTRINFHIGQSERGDIYWYIGSSKQVRSPA